MLCEFFDNKFWGIPTAMFQLLETNGFTTDTFIIAELLIHLAQHDTGIIVWKEKRFWDAVRPFSAIGHVYGEDKVKGLCALA